MAYFDSVLNTRMILAAAEDAHLDGRALLDGAGIDPALIEDPFAVLPASRQFALLEAAVHGSGEPAFGLRMSSLWNRPGAMDVVGYRIAAADTFRGLLEAGYGALSRLSNLQDIRVETRGDVSRIVLRPARMDWPLLNVLFDFYMANAVHQTQLFVSPEFGTDFAPLETLFMQRAPADPAPYAEFFRSPLRFDQPWGAVVFESRWLDVPSRLADPELSQAIDGVMAQRVPKPVPSAPLAARARSALADLLRDNTPTLAALAAQLHLRPRTLQHQLKCEELTYSQLVDDARRELALELLQAGEESLDEIAWRAGFQSQSPFFRAFRRWTGMTPAAYRRELRQR
ncbi:MAG TPA: AraC family transcriptional regulator [bacterium]|nr:AraC family transcriptional regulator [bacterium]